MQAREGGEESRALSRGGGGGGGDSGGGVAVVLLRWSGVVEDGRSSSLRVRSASGFGSLL